jgi:hypothetical protein
MSKRHHFVPVFYLKRFASRPRRINVFNIARGRLFEDASLREQCYRRGFYVHQDVEDQLGLLESRAAPVLAEVIDTATPTERGSTAHQILLQFVSLQLLRTLGAVEQTRRQMADLRDVVFHPSDPNRPPDDSHERVLELALTQASVFSGAIHDLVPVVIRNATELPFVASDQPIVRYNLYCEGVTWCGVVGARCSGLQVFVPLAPFLTLMLLDGRVYKIGSRGAGRSVDATPADVNVLNKVQAVSAHLNVYSSRADEPWLARLVRQTRRARHVSRPVTVEAIADDDPLDSIIHQYQAMPQLGLKLSFVQIRRNARKVPLGTRARSHRHGPQSGVGLRDDMGPGPKRRFSVAPHARTGQ